MKRLKCLATAVLLLSAVASSAQPPPPPPPSPLTYVQPPPPSAPPFEPAPPGSFAGETGWFFGVELALVKPTLQFNLVNQSPLGSPGQTLTVPAVGLGTTVSPKFEAGFRLPTGEAFAFSYRFLVAEGNEQQPRPADGVTDVRTRLDVQLFDADYLFAPVEFLPRWELSGRLGARLGNVFFDSRATDPFVLQQASNDFFGAGIHGRVDLERRIVIVPGLSVFGSIDGAMLVGQARQKFHLQQGGGEAEVAQQHEQRSVPMLNLRAGVNYVPAALPGLKFTTGYEYERIFSVGDVGPSQGEVYWHGWFLRARYEF